MITLFRDLLYTFYSNLNYIFIRFDHIFVHISTLTLLVNSQMVPVNITISSLLPRCIAADWIVNNSLLSDTSVCFSFEQAIWEYLLNKLVYPSLSYERPINQYLEQDSLKKSPFPKKKRTLHLHQLTADFFKTDPSPLNKSKCLRTKQNIDLLIKDQ